MSYSSIDLATALLLASAYTEQPPTDEALLWVLHKVRIVPTPEGTNFVGVGGDPAANEQVVQILERKWGIPRDELVDMCREAEANR